MRDGPKRPLGDREAADLGGQGQDVLLDLGRKAEQAHDLGHPGAGDGLPAGDIGLVGGFAGREEGLPLDRLAGKFGPAARPGRRRGQGLRRLERRIVAEALAEPAEDLLNEIQRASFNPAAGELRPAAGVKVS